MPKRSAVENALYRLRGWSAHPNTRTHDVALDVQVLLGHITSLENELETCRRHVEANRDKRQKAESLVSEYELLVQNARSRGLVL